MHVRTVAQAFGVKQHLSNKNYLRLEGHIENCRDISWLKYAAAVKSERRLLKIADALSQKVLIRNGSKMFWQHPLVHWIIVRKAYVEEKGESSKMGDNTNVTNTNACPSVVYVKTPVWLRNP